MVNRTAETEADLVVMGAYSESGLKEGLFDGTTHGLKGHAYLALMSR